VQRLGTLERMTITASLLKRDTVQQMDFIPMKGWIFHNNANQQTIPNLENSHCRPGRNWKACIFKAIIQLTAWIIDTYWINLDWCTVHALRLVSECACYTTQQRSLLVFFKQRGEQFLSNAFLHLGRSDSRGIVFVNDYSATNLCWSTSCC